VKFVVRGAGVYRAAANGNSVDLEPFHAPRMKLFGGQLTAIVQTTGQAGPIVFEASAPGVKSAVLELIGE
jgi:beta-galactosidase